MPLPPYAGTFGKAELLHLLRRTLFGVTKNDLNHFSGRSLPQVLSVLLTAPPPAPPPVKDYDAANTTDTTVLYGQTWVNGPYLGSANGSRVNSLRGWWMGNMINQDRSVFEKMVLFWHNHMPVEFSNGANDAIMCYQYMALLRSYALGNFKDFVRDMTLNTAMLYYLDGRRNTRTAPNENYGRELQELFTVGKDLPAYFSETDVVQAAKVLTGWKVNTTTYTSYFDSASHEPANKSFSAFYNNTVITGRTGPNAGIDELNDLLNMIFAHPEVARFLCRKLYRYFVYYQITPQVEQQVIVPLADTLRTNNYNILPVLQELLGSQHFFDAMQRSCLIRNPVDLAVGFARVFQINFAAAPDYFSQYRNWRYFNTLCDQQQMQPGNPPSVAGWPAYYQVPNFHELWMNSVSLRYKKEMYDRFLYNTYNGSTIDVLTFTQTLDNPADPDLLIAECVELLLPLPLDSSVTNALKAILLSNQALNSYWTTAWTNYINNPGNTTHANTARTRLRAFYQALVNLAEYQLT